MACACALYSMKVVICAVHVVAAAACSSSAGSTSIMRCPRVSCCFLQCSVDIGVAGALQDGLMDGT